MQLRWATVMERGNELQTSFDAQFQASCDLGIKATEYSVLKSELNRTERLCEILDDRIKELNVTEDVGALNISILEVARPAGGPSKPEKKKSRKRLGCFLLKTHIEIEELWQKATGFVDS